MFASTTAGRAFATAVPEVVIKTATLPDLPNPNAQKAAERSS